MNGLPYTHGMVVRSVRHRGLRRLIEEDNPRFLRQNLIDRGRKNFDGADSG